MKQKDIALEMNFRYVCIFKSMVFPFIVAEYHLLNLSRVTGTEVTTMPGSVSTNSICYIIEMRVWLIVWGIGE